MCPLTPRAQPPRPTRLAYAGNPPPPFDRITIQAGKMGGKPCIRGLRITVRRVVEWIGEYRDWDKLFEDYPDLEPDDLRQPLEFALARLDGTIDVHLDAA
jgi:uncharacterized protein (DUF433 family)